MRSWLVLVTVAVVAVAGFCVYRLHGIFAAPDNQWSSSGFSDDLASCNPKHTTLQGFEAPGAVATIEYLDVDAQPQLVDHAELPWSYTMTTTLPAVAANPVAQGNSSSIGCRVLVNGVVKDERQSTKCTPTPSAWSNLYNETPAPAVLAGAHHLPPFRTDPAVLAGAGCHHQRVSATVGRCRQPTHRFAEP